MSFLLESYSEGVPYVLPGVDSGTMLRIHLSQSVSSAKHYFDEELQHDYYDRGSAPAKWFGKGAEMLGLEGVVSREDFHLLCDNKRPDNGEKLNPRNNAVRRPCYDFTFNCPKGVGLLFSVLSEERVLTVFHEAVHETLSYIEEDLHVRVRKGGIVDTRKTGNCIGSLFTHFEARPVDGISDPALHLHAIIQNSSFDHVEKKFKAGEFFPVIRDAVYYEAIFHSRLAEKIQKLGYGIENRPFSFEISGIGEENLRLFSRRTTEIEALGRKLGISADAKAMSKLAAVSRKKKQSGLSGAERDAEWRERFDWSALDLEFGERSQPVTSPREAVDLAIGHLFERKSVVSGRRILAEAMQCSLGCTSLEDIVREVKAHPELLFRAIDGVTYGTTRAVLHEEQSILQFLTDTRGTEIPMLAWYREKSDALDSDQKGAVEAVMRSRDRVVCISGRAGSGKTTMMSTCVAAMEKVGMGVAVFAPSSAAAHQVLKDEGFANSETIQQLLINPKLQEEVKGKVLWIDEAGLLSSTDMFKLTKIATAQNARLVLSGDFFQGKSVERGDSFRQICESLLVTVRETRSVYRQRNAAYKSAVTALSIGDAESAMDILDEMGAIREVGNFEDRFKMAAKEFVESLDQHRSVLAVSPTHLEGRLLTQEIRNQLRSVGKLDTKEVACPVYRSRNLTEAQQAQTHHYRKGDVIRFHRKDDHGFARGDLAKIVDTNEQGVFVRKAGEEQLHQLPFDSASRFAVFEEAVVNLASGDLVRVTRNTKSAAGKKLFNGSIHRITSMSGDGTVTLDDKHQISTDEGFLELGYLRTSHSAQGSTADKVIISQSGLSFDAASLEQFYVSVSRGRDAIAIFTDNRDGLLNSVRDPSHRMLATELGSWPSIDEGMIFPAFGENEREPEMGY